MDKRFKAFTLVEMLIVMGIIIILMAVGIASGRYALQRANKIEHENAAEQIYQGLQSYYADMREYPDDEAPSTLVDTTLAEYIDGFDGGSEATYLYDVDDSNQSVLICVTLGGQGDDNDLGIYCTGNGVGASGLSALLTVSEKELPYADSGTEYNTILSVMDAGTNTSNWDPEDEWGTPAL